MKINIEYQVTTSFCITVERDELPKDHDALLESVTRDEIVDLPMEVYDIEWDHIKYAWRESSPENTYVTDENDNPLYVD
jgi:hypothetical protein